MSPTKKKSSGKKKSTKAKGRKSTRKRKKNSAPEWPDFSWLLHPILWAVLLFFFGLLTIGALVPTGDGALLKWWREHIRLLVGNAVYLVPIGLIATSWWLMRYAVLQDDEEAEEEVGPPTWRVVGLFLLVVGIAAFLHFLAFSPEPEVLAQAGRGGGIIGFVLSDFLVRNLGAWLTPLVLGLIILIGTFFALALTPKDGWRLARRVVTWVRGKPPVEEMGEPEDLWDIPLIEEAEAYQPWWKRLWQRVREWRTSRQVSQEPLPTHIIGEAPEAEEPVVSSYTPADHSLIVDEEPEPPSPRPTPRPVTTTSPAETRPAPVIGTDVAGRSWQLPDIREIFDEGEESDLSEEEIRQRSRVIEETLAAFGVPVRVVEVNRGPTVTQFGIQPGYIEKVDRKTGTVRREKVKVSRILALQNDLALALAAAPIRIEAPVPGKPIVGIEVPNKRTALVTLRSVLESDVWRTFKGRLKIALGQDVAGRPVVADLARMPHLLIAGATGSGKSVCINAIISCLLATHTPEEVRFILVDPKRVELTVYEGVPHLIGSVLTDVEVVVTVLQWAVREMERRYEMFAKVRVRDIVRYNKKVQAEGKPRLPYIIIVVDELADLMLSAPDEVEHAIVRLAQMARATGIHMVLATQRPSVDVVTGLIKANFPARIAFAVTSQVDSRVILDSPGAEQLLGQGDMLFMPPDSSKLARLQGVYVSDAEIQRLVDFWRRQRPQVPEDVSQQSEEENTAGFSGFPGEQEPEQWEQRPLWDDLLEDIKAEKARSGRDPLFDEAVRVVREANRASISLLQRRLRIGYARAGRLIDELEAAGIIGPDPGGGRSRQVYPPSSPSEQQPAPRTEEDGFAAETPVLPENPVVEEGGAEGEQEEKKKRKRVPRVWF